jgi:Domain of unknown function (DUF4062)
VAAFEWIAGAHQMSVSIFLSTVSDEFRTYRDQLRADLTRHNTEVKVQEDFKDYGGVTLDKLDLYIKACDAVVHLVGDMTGAAAKSESTAAILAKYPSLPDKLHPLRRPLADGLDISYTQWEAWLALYHGKRLVIAKAADTAPRGPKYASCRAARASHTARRRRALSGRRVHQSRQSRQANSLRSDPRSVGGGLRGGSGARP